MVCKGWTSLGIVSNSPFNLTWTNCTPGNYTLKAVATDNDNLSTTSAPVSVLIQDPRSRTFTRNMDFEAGTLVNVNYRTIADQLQLNSDATVFPFLYVPASCRGSVMRVDANSGQIVGEYYT